MLENSSARLSARPVGLDDAQLKQHLNRRVQLDGAFARTDATARRDDVSRDSAAPDVPMAEIRATAIRAVTGECATR